MRPAVGAAMMEELYLEDCWVGRTFAAGPLTVDAGQIKTFAASFDPQPFHLDEGLAQDTFFNGLVASGWHTAGLTMRLLTQTVKLAGGIVGAGAQITWPLPVRPGDELRIEIEIVEARPLRSRADRGMVKTRITTFNQDGGAVQILVTDLVARRRSPSSENPAVIET